MNVIEKSSAVLVLFDEKVESIEQKLQEFKNVTYLQLDKLSNEPSDLTYHSILLKHSSLFNDVENVETFFKRIYQHLKPEGVLIALHPAEFTQKLTFLLKTNGFINVSTETTSEFDTTLHEARCSKPTYEIGSSAKLNLAKKPINNVWKLDDVLDDDIETIDPDSLLDQDDFLKPDQSSLRVCGTTGKRKACKDCSCGLADELNGEQIVIKSAEAKSSCGSCYLGDAFRCAACPYLGMPAFKPGEKVQVSDGLLKSDL